jgi:3'-phosphoadenosine 5'-phosphosulfate sulfotransferase (PAPS reductase)/FAD synthetase
MQQLKLFKTQIPDWLDALLESPSTVLALGISGGKDSQALMRYICKQNYSCQIIAIHADVGERAEWKGTKDFIVQLCSEQNLELTIVAHPDGDLLDYILKRKEQRQGQVFWMSAKSRYCTSTFKTAPINKYSRRFNTVINATGIRAEESTNRARKPNISYHSICSQKYLDLPFSKAVKQHLEKPLGRLAIDWKPLFDWDLEQVWLECGTSTQEWLRRRKIECDRVAEAMPHREATDGWKCHYAYVVGRGNTRLSCAFCMLASANDLLNAIPYNHESYQFLTQLEAETGYSFQPKRYLSKLNNYENLSI